MLLYEFDDPQDGNLVVAVDRLAHDLDSGKINSEWTVDQLLTYLEQYDIILDVSDILKLYKKPPMKKVISNIQNDKVVWRSENMPADSGTPTDKNEKTVKQMADRANKL
jgi:hypothetical protein